MVANYNYTFPITAQRSTCFLRSFEVYFLMFALRSHICKPVLIQPQCFFSEFCVAFLYIFSPKSRKWHCKDGLWAADVKETILFPHKHNPCVLWPVLLQTRGVCITWPLPVHPSMLFGSRFFGIWKHEEDLSIQNSWTPPLHTLWFCGFDRKSLHLACMWASWKCCIKEEEKAWCCCFYGKSLWSTLLDDNPQLWRLVPPGVSGSNCLK